ncbi:hypothetical protein HMPREF3291_05260 [Bacillus sp. HMSC76G11]|nr:hypothetical protein HMPREF3291_05260 [Bacillus sp. HMSC76G11]
MTWDEQKVNSLKGYKEQGLTVNEIIEKMSEEYQEGFTYWSITKKLGRLDHTQHPVKNTEYKETIEIQPDGTHKSDKLLQMSSEQSKDKNYLLRAHGYDLNEWELISAKSNIWNSYSKQDGVMTLYSSKITVKPKVSGFDWDGLLRKIETIPSKLIEPQYITDIGYLNLPLFDMHFGVSSYEYYKPTQERILGLLLNGYKEVLFIIGQDLLHNDNFKGQTANGTQIDKVDMERAWEEAMLFYVPLIETALEKCKRVTIKYSKGNHDESMSWAFVQCLKVRFPQAIVDTSFKERKVHMLGLNFVGMNHGDKKKEQNLNENFSTEFPIEWSKAKTREIFTGHLHHERVLDKGGAVLRRMPTANEIDGYHDDHGYTTAHKRFEVLEYSEDAVKRIHYV